MNATAIQKTIITSVLVIAAGASITTADQQVIVRSTFDDYGANDHDHLPKDANATISSPVTPDDGPTAIEGGGPPNDNCSSATEIPGNIINYNPPLLNTTGALLSLCDPNESCDSNNGTSKSVFYRYTPDFDGFVRISTNGTNYDTVLSVFDDCAFFCTPFPCCQQPNEIACNNDYFFSTTSQIDMVVEAGETYIIKAAQLGTSGSGGLLDFFLSWTPLNTVCANATEIIGTAYNPPLYSTTNADGDLCESQESCEFNNVGVSNSVFYSYVPPCDGHINVNTNGSSYDTVLSIWDGCGQFVDIDAPCITANEIACDDDAGTGVDSQLEDVPVIGGQEYIIKVADYNVLQGGGFLDFNFLFDGAYDPIAEITEPDNFSCNCDMVTIEGTAAEPQGGFASYAVEYKGSQQSDWTLINSSEQEVTNGVLAQWNTSLLPTGHYFVRLTVEGACGLSSTEIVVIYVDHTFGNLEVRSPRENIPYGGVVCVDGTAWDQCFSHYTVNYTPADDEQYMPVDPNNPVFTNGVINDPLAQWNTPAQGIQDGEYIIEVRASDACENSDSISIPIEIDNTPPDAEIRLPEACSCVEGEVEIWGTASDDNFTHWILQYAGAGQQWTTIDAGEERIVDDYLTTWDTSEVASCAYALRLLVYSNVWMNCDNYAWSEYVTTVEVGCEQYNFDTDNDGDVDMVDYAVFETEFTGPN